MTKMAAVLSYATYAVNPGQMTPRRWYYAKLAAFSSFPLVPLLAPVGYFAGVPWLSAFVVFVLVPLLDLLIGSDQTRPLEKPPSLAIGWLRMVPRLYVFVWLPTLLWAAYELNSGDVRGATAMWLIISIALATAFATCVAHELLHWPGPFDRALARLIMATVAYGQFPIEHLHHHDEVGLVRAGTTPTLGQSIWSFLARNVAFTFRSAWTIERRRQLSKHLPLLANRFVQQWLLTGAIAVLFVMIGGAWGLMLFLAQAAFGIFTTEYVNYAQHYGLARAPGTPTRGDLSWNSNGFMTNAFTLNITRHVHHHLRADIPYYNLEYIGSMPLLPAGYLALFFPVMIPALWRRIMDARAQKFAGA